MNNARPSQPRDTANWTTREWAAWFAGTGLVASIRPTDPACKLCATPVKLRWDGDPFDYCYDCQHSDGFRQHLRRVVPIAYAVSGGLTSLVAQAKDEPSRWWVRVGMASLMSNFLVEHRHCLERLAHGSFDYATIVPSHANRRNGVDHMKQLMGSITGAGAWAALNWDLELLSKVGESNAATRRGVVDHSLFCARSDVNLAGRRVLLLDDLFTAGGTLASAAAALTAAGADPVVALTLGRQVRLDREASANFWAESDVTTRGFEPGICAAHAEDDPWRSSALWQERPW